MQTQEICKGKPTGGCDACANTIAYMFTKYERHVEMALENVFREVADRRTKSLEEARREARGT